MDNNNNDKMNNKAQVNVGCIVSLLGVHIMQLFHVDVGDLTTRNDLGLRVLLLLCDRPSRFPFFGFQNQHAVKIVSSFTFRKLITHPRFGAET